MCFGQKTVILVDEYDQWVQNVRSTELFESLVGAIRPFMQQTFKFNDYIQFGFVTGIMPMAKTSMLSSFNNASICSILDERGDESFGFTEGEVSRLLEETGNPPEKMDEIREWYDGYRFEDAEVYNPYSVMLYLQTRCRPEAYWNNMTGGGLSKDLLSSMGARPLAELRRLSEEEGSTLDPPWTSA
ncbi:MAG: AAA family ATPase [Candidatus Methanomethylophilaceae archaeon]|nr:AAA family ATPase [Candidatus Methanomethylophilaceae archaeon]